MSPAVESQLSQKERKQLRLAFKNDWSRRLSRGELWSTVGGGVALILGFILIYVLIVSWGGLLSADEVTRYLKYLAVIALFLQATVGVGRREALIRRLHDIAAEALEPKAPQDAA